MKQTSLADSVAVEGVGVHQGKPARVVLHPAEAHSGITFCRTNLPEGRERLIQAKSRFVQNTELCTIIGDGGSASVATIEHLMSALFGLGVDNAIIEIDGPEMPILDGSARLFVDAIDQVGLKTLSASRRVLKVLKPVRVELGSGFVELLPQREGFRLDVDIEFTNKVIGRQSYGFTLEAQAYRREIASARTFGFMQDVERLWKAGLALGASLENTIAVGDDGVVNPEGLRYPDEFVRHKILDAIGDLALAGHPIQGHYRAFCPGHKLNAMVVEALLADRSNYAVVDLRPSMNNRGANDFFNTQPIYASNRG